VSGDPCAKQRSQRRLRDRAPKADDFKLDAVYASEMAGFNVYTGVMGSIKVVEGIIYKKTKSNASLEAFDLVLSSQCFGIPIKCC
jgi:hypothetical protein